MAALFYFDLGAALLGSLAGDSVAHNDQDLHQDKIAKLEFALEAVIWRLHEVHATRTLDGPSFFLARIRSGDHVPFSLYLPVFYGLT
jgi:hypothetical protein